MVARTWVHKRGTLLDKKQGYAVKTTGAKKKPFVAEVWYGKRVWREDPFPTKAKALSYARSRKISFYGRKTRVDKGTKKRA